MDDPLAGYHRRSSVFIVDIEYMWHLLLVLTLKM